MSTHAIKSLEPPSTQARDTAICRPRCHVPAPMCTLTHVIAVSRLCNALNAITSRACCPPSLHPLVPCARSAVCAHLRALPHRLFHFSGANSSRCISGLTLHKQENENGSSTFGQIVHQSFYFVLEIVVMCIRNLASVVCICIILRTQAPHEAGQEVTECKQALGRNLQCRQRGN